MFLQQNELKNLIHFIIQHFFLIRLVTEWQQVQNNVKPGDTLVVLDLDPAEWYHLRVTAHNNAGFTVAEYEFATLTVLGGECNISFMHLLLSKRFLEF